jgi:hypothetical protein
LLRRNDKVPEIVVSLDAGQVKRFVTGVKKSKCDSSLADRQQAITKSFSGGGMRRQGS